MHVHKFSLLSLSGYSEIRVRVFGMVFGGERGGVGKEHNRTAVWLEGLKRERDYDQQEAHEKYPR